MPRTERRGSIVRAAMKEFARHGFRGTRTRELARAAGVSEALLFHFFPTKRALQQAIIEERIRQSGDIPAETSDRRPPISVLSSIASHFIRLCDRDPSFMRLLYFSGLEGEPLAPMFFRTRVARNIERVAEMIRRWSREGHVRRGIDPRLAAWCFMASVFQLLVARHLFGVRRFQMRSGNLASRVARMFFEGLKP
jgi:AcrR family transcriptional regulator